MMERIGRKMYLDFGNRMVAIEKLYALPSSLGLDGINNPTELYDIFECMGERVERKVVGTQRKQFGCDVNYYMEDVGLWLTQEESDSIYKTKKEMINNG